MIIADKIKKCYGDAVVINSFSYSFPDSGLFVFFGASGSGKTTALRIMAGLEKPDSGSVIRNGIISVLFQENRLFPWLDLQNNITLRRHHTSECRGISELLESVGLFGEEKKLPAELSGGMQRRAALARAIYSDFDVLLADEPFAGIDDAGTVKVATLLYSLSTKKLIIAVTHDLRPLEKYKPEIIHFPL